MNERGQIYRDERDMYTSGNEEAETFSCSSEIRSR